MFVPATRRWILALVAAAALAVAGLNIRGAVAWYERPFAGILLDPEGVVSNLGLPTWQGVQHGLRYPDRLIEVDGVEVGASSGRYRAGVWDAAVEDAARAGRATISARFDTRSGPRLLELPVQPFDPLSWWLYAGGPMIIASLYVVAGLIAISASPRGKLARAFAKTSLFAALFLFTLFDYHTSREHVPLFHVAFALMPMGFFLLPLRLPDDVSLLRRRPWLSRAADAAGWLLALGMLAQLAAGRTTVALRDVCSALLAASFLFFAVTFLLRFARAEGHRRRTLRVLLIAMVPPHAIVGLGFIAGMLGPSPSTIWYILPAFALTPLSSIFAFVRYDLWGSRALLSRPVARLIIAGVMLAFTVALSAAACAPLFGLPIAGALKVAALAAALGVGLVVYALGAGDRTLFPARADYKPTIEQLSEELTFVADPDEVAGAVERTVRRWLACERVAFRRLESAPEGAAEDSAESSGQRAIVRYPSQPDGAELVLTVSCYGRPLGVIEVGPKRGGALFTSEDIDLLRTIGNLAALAMAHALSYAELERRRREQAAAWRDERVALIETVAAEITHEVRYPINFFRSIFNRGVTGQHLQLDAEEVDIGYEEVERLERLVMGLRRVAHRRLDRRALRIRDLVNKAETLLRDQLGKRRVDLRIDGPAHLRCDPDQVTQVLVNLLSNGLDAAGERGAVGVRWSFGPAGAELCVWDTGPGIVGDPARIFAPWYTTKPRGTGLGLAIAHRLVRAHGWSIGPERRDGRTWFVISIPASDVAETAKGTELPEEEVA